MNGEWKSFNISGEALELVINKVSSALVSIKSCAPACTRGRLQDAWSKFEVKCRW